MKLCVATLLDSHPVSKAEGPVVTIYWEECLGLELWSVLGSTYIAAVLPVTLPAFPNFIFLNYQ